MFNALCSAEEISAAHHSSPPSSYGSHELASARVSASTSTSSVANVATAKSRAPPLRAIAPLSWALSSPLSVCLEKRLDSVFLLRTVWPLRCGKMSGRCWRAGDSRWKLRAFAGWSVPGEQNITCAVYSMRADKRRVTMFFSGTTVIRKRVVSTNCFWMNVHSDDMAFRNYRRMAIGSWRTLPATSKTTRKVKMESLSSC